MGQDREWTRPRDELIITDNQRHIKQVLCELHVARYARRISATVLTTPDARLLLTENIQIKHYRGLQGELAEIPTE